MAQGLIPALYSSGLFVIQAPFDALLGGNNYRLRCVAVRGFEDVYAEGKDVFKDYYEPSGLTNTVVAADQNDRVCIVTLESDTGLQFHIPSSYLGELPVGNTIPYSHVVLSISLSAIPDALDLTALKEQLETVTSDLIGVEPTVLEHRAPTIDGLAITPAAHATMETGRLAAIGTRDTVYSTNLKLMQLNNSLQQRLATLEDFIIANGLTP